MEIVSINPKGKKEQERKEQLLEVLDEIRKQVEDGNIQEMVSCVSTADGDCQIFASCNDMLGGVGLFEVGKHILISQEA
jgi:hypothetical protein